jgi:hypothetical protein
MSKVLAEMLGKEFGMLENHDRITALQTGSLVTTYFSRKLIYICLTWISVLFISNPDLIFFSYNISHKLGQEKIICHDYQ